MAKTEETNNLKYISPCPGEFPILGSTICVDHENPKREEFIMARECGLSGGSSDVVYRAIFNSDHNLNGNDLTSKYAPTINNTGIHLLINNKLLIFDKKQTAHITEYYNQNLLYTLKQMFVTAFMMEDEPSWKDISTEGSSSDTISQGDSILVKKDYLIKEMLKLCSANGLPPRQWVFNLSPVYDTASGVKSYLSYLELIESTIHPMLWSFDHYPADILRNVLCYNIDEYFNLLDCFRAISKSTDAPFKVFCLSTEFISANGEHYQALPTINRVRFQVFAALAYGAQEIQYWTYSQRNHSETEYYICSPINRLGKKTEEWYIIKKINQEIRKYTRIFHGARVISLQHAESNYKKPADVPSLVTLDYPVQKIEVSEPMPDYDARFKGVLVSYLSNNPDKRYTSTAEEGSTSRYAVTKYYLVVLNRDPDNYKTVKITFKSNFMVSEISSRVLGIGSDNNSSHTITRVLEPGGYLIFECAKIFQTS